MILLGSCEGNTRNKELECSNLDQGSYVIEINTSREYELIVNETNNSVRIIAKNKLFDTGDKLVVYGR